MPLPKYEDTGLGELNQTFDDLLKQVGGPVLQSIRIPMLGLPPGCLPAQ